MEIRRLDKEIYAGEKFTARYTTGGYYDICTSESGFQMRYTAFATPVEKSFEDVFFGEWLENPLAFGAFEGEKLIGYVEGSMEGWNNRFRISNICVFDHPGFSGYRFSLHRFHKLGSDAAITWLDAQGEGLTGYLKKLQLVDEAYQKLLKSAVKIEGEIAWDSEAAELPVGAVEAVMRSAGRR